MIDFPVADLFDDSLCLLWLERHLHPDGFVCPHCGSADRRHFRPSTMHNRFDTEWKNKKHRLWHAPNFLPVLRCLRHLKVTYPALAERDILWLQKVGR